MKTSPFMDGSVRALGAPVELAGRAPCRPTGWSGEASPDPGPTVGAPLRATVPFRPVCPHHAQQHVPGLTWNEYQVVTCTRGPHLVPAPQSDNVERLRGFEGLGGFPSSFKSFRRGPFLPLVSPPLSEEFETIESNS